MKLSQKKWLFMLGVACTFTLKEGGASDLLYPLMEPLSKKQKLYGLAEGNKYMKENNQQSPSNFEVLHKNCSQAEKIIIIKQKEQFSSEIIDRPASIIIDPYFSFADDNINTIESWLKNSMIHYVVLDNRSDYKERGDRAIIKNMGIIQAWYPKLIKSVGKENIHRRLVCLPENKIMDDLESGNSFIPEPWLNGMLSYHLNHKTSSAFTLD